MATVVSRVESYVKHLSRGTVFTFSAVVSHTGSSSKDTVNHALKKLSKTNEIVHLKKGVYARPEMSRFGSIPVDPGKVVQVTAKNIGAKVFPSGAAALNVLGLSRQLSMSYSYVSTKRIASFRINSVNINFRYSRALERIERNISGLVSEEREKVLLFWLALEYLGEQETLQLLDKIQASVAELSPIAQEVLYKSLSGKLSWAKRMFDQKGINENTISFQTGK